jgi:hypothetical protein
MPELGRDGLAIKPWVKGVGTVPRVLGPGFYVGFDKRIGENRSVKDLSFIYHPTPTGNFVLYLATTGCCSLPIFFK